MLIISLQNSAAKIKLLGNVGKHQDTLNLSVSLKSYAYNHNTLTAGSDFCCVSLPHETEHNEMKDGEEACRRLLEGWGTTTEQKVKPGEDAAG